MLKTTGLTEPIRDALRPMAKRIHTAFVFGSVAKGTDNASSDIDLLIISDSLDHADIFQALEPAEQILGRKINPTVTTLAAWRNKRTRPDSFPGSAAFYEALKPSRRLVVRGDGRWAAGPTRVVLSLLAAITLLSPFSLY